MTDLAVRQSTSLSTYMHSEGAIKRFDEILGKGNSGGYISSVMIAVSQNQKLMECRKDSILGSALRAATMRLSVDPSVGHAYLVPFKGQCTLIVGYKGIYQMALRTNKYRYLELTPVFKDDKLVEDRRTGLIEFDLGDGVTATPMRRRVKYDLDDVQGYILYFKLTSGFEKTFYMTVEEIEEHGAKFSKTYAFADSPWKTNKRAMYEKTVIRLGLLKWGYLDPSDIQSINQVEYDENEIVEGEATEFQTDEESDITAAQSMTDLGYDDEQPKPKPSTGAMTYEQACAVKGSKGELYGNLTDEELTGKRYGINKIVNNPDTDPAKQSAALNKLEAIKILLSVPESERLQRAGQPAMEFDQD